MPGKVAKEGGSFSTKAPADLDPGSDETCPLCARELGVRLAPLAVGGLDGRGRVAARLRLPVPRPSSASCAPCQRSRPFATTSMQCNARR